MSRRGRATRVLTILVAAAALMVPAAASATPPEQSGVVDRVVVSGILGHRVWAGDGLVVLEGPPLEDGCQLLGFGEYTETVVTTPAGVVTASSTHTDQVWVFDDEGFDDVFAWFGYACTELPAPAAHGEGRVVLNTLVDADGVERTRSRLTATVTTADGRRVHLTAHGEDGVFPDFVNYGG